MEWKQQLEELGYCVVPCLSEEEVRFGFRLFQNWFQKNETTIPPHGVFKFQNVGHTGFAWWCRTRPQVLQCFKSIWGVSDLIVSYDGLCYFPKNLSRRNTEWLHVDQAPNDPGFRCVQGFLSFTTNEKATLTLVPRSHHLFASYMLEHHLSHSRPWQKISGYYDQAVRVPVKSGDLVLWDSRVFHQNSYGGEERLVQYLCYLPRIFATKRNLEKRKKYFQEKRTTSHWPTPVRVNGLQPQVFGNKEKLIDYATIQDPTSYLLEDLQIEINKLI